MTSQGEKVLSGYGIQYLQCTVHFRYSCRLGLLYLLGYYIRPEYNRIIFVPGKEATLSEWPLSAWPLYPEYTVVRKHNSKYWRDGPGTVTVLEGQPKKTRRLAIILDYRVCKVTLILGKRCPENKKEFNIVTIFFIVSVLFHYRDCFFSLSWLFFSLSWVLFP